MGDRTGIAWTDSTWNPTRGCRRTSPGCENCYAERQAARFSGPGAPFEGLVRIGKSGPRWTGEGRLAESMLDQPIRWRRSRRIFVDSMSDLFFNAFSDEDIAAVFGVMALACHHTFQVLTKRHVRARDLLSKLTLDDITIAALDRGVGVSKSQTRAIRDALPKGSPFAHDSEAPIWPLPNVWIGVSVEDQARADERLPVLAQIPAAVRFVSAEPLLEVVDLSKHLTVNGPDWVIVGGESGPGARTFAIQWARNIITQCRAARVACFVKQMGARCSRFPDAWPEKIVARDGMPSAAPLRPQAAPFRYSEAAQIQIGELLRENAAMAKIAEQNASELKTLREDKKELERRLKDAKKSRTKCKVCERGDDACAFCAQPPKGKRINGPTFVVCLVCAETVGHLASDIRKEALPS
jgi:protein gp37